MLFRSTPPDTKAPSARLQLKRPQPRDRGRWSGRGWGPVSDSVTERGRVTSEGPACAKASRSDIGEKLQENWRGSGVCREQTVVK